MIAMIDSLISRDNAYVVDNHVLFSVPSMVMWKAIKANDVTYSLALMLHKDPKFCIVKPSEINSPRWESPWGRGRPGCTLSVRL